MDELKRSGGVRMVLALAGNKLDLAEQRQVPQEKALAYAEENGIFFIETSAKTSQNVRRPFFNPSFPPSPLLCSGQRSQSELENWRVGDLDLGLCLDRGIQIRIRVKSRHQQFVSYSSINDCQRFWFLEVSDMEQCARSLENFSVSSEGLE